MSAPGAASSRNPEASAAGSGPPDVRCAWITFPGELSLFELRAERLTLEAAMRPVNMRMLIERSQGHGLITLRSSVRVHSFPTSIQGARAQVRSC